MASSQGRGEWTSAVKKEEKQERPKALAGANLRVTPAAAAQTPDLRVAATYGRGGGLEKEELGWDGREKGGCLRLRGIGVKIGTESPGGWGRFKPQRT